MASWDVKIDFVQGTTTIGEETITVNTLGGAPGTNGTDGTNGTNGVGVVAGGNLGQFLAKASNTDYDTEWRDTLNSYAIGEPTGSDIVVNVVSLTQAEYDAGTPIATTFYIIK